MTDARATLLDWVDAGALPRERFPDAMRVAEAGPGRTGAPFGPIEVDVLGGEAFIRNKRATGRGKDLGDLEGLGE